MQHDGGCSACIPAKHFCEAAGGSLQLRTYSLRRVQQQELKASNCQLSYLQLQQGAAVEWFGDLEEVSGLHGNDGCAAASRARICQRQLPCIEQSFLKCQGQPFIHCSSTIGTELSVLVPALGVVIDQCQQRQSARKVRQQLQTPLEMHWQGMQY